MWMGFVSLNWSTGVRYVPQERTCSVRGGKGRAYWVGLEAGGQDGWMPPFMNGPMAGDVLVRTISANGEVTCKAVVATGLVAGAAAHFGCSPVAAAAFGRALVCAILLGAGKKDKETVQLEFRGNGPLRGLVAMANGTGEVRGYVGEPRVQLPPSPQGKLDVGRAVGDGILSVVRNHPAYRRPFTGLTQLVSGEIAEDVAHYLATSEQVPSALAAGVFVSDSGQVSAAGGYLVQLLPGASEQSISKVEQNLEGLPSPTELLRSGQVAQSIVNNLLMRDLSPLSMQESFPRYRCTCDKSRLKRTVVLLGRKDIEELLEQQSQLEGTCEFCGKKYILSSKEVQTLLLETL
mmetsp:Transcript_1107/g.2316  ORF Transcript_1107/g.2316 Transcript_1107/m.2316 type:complete len:348 (-) Transcript_1107:1670-2713(-)